ncbi:MAG: valine--tRNA ligase [Bacteroidetes bacterium]|nr:MAG: valine--tRNA ligase [Bacteroidota bacterium]
MKPLPTHYDPSTKERKWYDHWMQRGYFRSVPDEREPYTIVIPPPNVTGVLHMGHMLNNTIQDILIRRARQKGFNACWVPGTDHASIATEAKVVKMLRERGISKDQISREEFLKYAWEWKEKYGGIILEQLKLLGASCDWERTRFTMEEKLSRAVIHVFVDLYRKGKIYRGLRMTNWDPEAKTALSNEEVIYTEEQSKLYYVRYRIEGTEDEWITIATVRPETILGDTAIAVHPEDERYTHLVGKRALVPLIERSIPIIADAYVQREFGTGALKITPAHDPNDYEIGLRHQLEIVDTLNEDGTLNEAAQLYVGKDRFEARKLIVADLEAAGHLVKVEDYLNKVGRSERTNAIVEPRLTMQWFLSMKEFARTALDAVRNGDIRFFPPHFWNMYHSWLNEDSVRDWCISRQLWWGQRIPAWYYGEEERFVVAETPEEALELARRESGNPNLQPEDLRQDPDVVDTWFSSWLWPLSVFDGFETPDELRYYYPTSVLVTGWDIIFFWVARMIIAGYEYAEELLGPEVVAKKGKQPFRDVFFTGMVRDNQRRKMSKSLGNSPDAIALIEKYGADGVRFGLLSCATAGNDIIFDAPIDPKTGKVRNESQLCEQGRKFCNKMWNALRLVKGWQVSDAPTPAPNRLALLWMQAKLQQTVNTIEEHYAGYRLSDVLMTLYNFIWGDFCSWHLEMVKPAYGRPLDRETYEGTLALFEKLMTLLHPFMPFVTEEIWQQLRERGPGEDCIVSPYPETGAFDEALLQKMDAARDLVTKCRELRNNQGIPQKEALRLFGRKGSPAEAWFQLEGLAELVRKMANLSAIEWVEEEPPQALAFLTGTEKFFLEVNTAIDVAAECEKAAKELEYYRGFVASVSKKLANERFVQNAPEAVVERERKKLADGQEKIRILEETLKRLGCANGKG